MLEVAAITDHYNAIVARRCRVFPLLRTIGSPGTNDHIRIRETIGGHTTDRHVYARVLHVWTLTGGALGPIHMLSIEVVIQSEPKLRALEGADTWPGDG